MKYSFRVAGNFAKITATTVSSLNSTPELAGTKNHSRFLVADRWHSGAPT